MRMTKDGKIASVPADKVSEMLRRGWAPVPEGESESEHEEDMPPPPKEDAPVSDAVKGFAAGASRFGTAGFDDAIGGGMTALMEAVSPSSTSDEGDDFLTRLQKGYAQGKADRRATVDKAYEASPNAYRAGAVAGGIGAAALAPELAAGGELAVLSGLGLSDADLTSPEAIKSAALSLAGSELLGAAANKAKPVLGAAFSRLSDSAKEAAKRIASLPPDARTKAIDALTTLIKKGPINVAKDKATSALQSLKPKAPVEAPTPPAPPPVDNSFAEAMAADALSKRLGGLIDEPMPTMAPLNPRTPAEQIPKALSPRTPADQIPKPPADALDELATARMTPASQALPEQMTSIVPVVTKNSSAGNIAKAVEAKAIELGTTDLATIANALKLPTNLVSDPLKNAVSRFAFREAVKGATKAPVVPATAPRGDALAEMASEGQQMPMEALAAIRQAKIETPRSLLPGDRPMAQVAGANQGAEMRAAFAALKPEQRPQWIETLRQQGFSDEKIRTMIGMTKAEWRRTSFNR